MEICEALQQKVSRDMFSSISPLIPGHFCHNKIEMTNVL
jgi:hypothetical protein